MDRHLVECQLELEECSKNDGRIILRNAYSSQRLLHQACSRMAEVVLMERNGKANTGTAACERPPRGYPVKILR